jgi:hypothetical protein
MVLFAGPVFEQRWWYAAVGLAVYALPVCMLVAFAADVGIRRWIRPLSGAQRYALWATVAAGIPLLILVASLSLGYGKLTPQGRAALRAIDFTTYEPRPLPPAFTVTRVEPTNEGGVPTLRSNYAAVRSEPAHSTQRRLRIAGIPGTGDQCPISGSTVACRELRSPKGIQVSVKEPYPHEQDATALLGGTIVNLRSHGQTDADVLAFFDSLQPVDKDDIEIVVQ